MTCYNTSSIINEISDLIRYIMPSLNTLLKTCSNKNEKLDLISEVFERIKLKVDEVLIFGACNSEVAIRARTRYFEQKELATRNHFFKDNSENTGLKAIPLIVSHYPIFEIPPQSMTTSPEQYYEALLKTGYLYGTGTCEIFSIVGAYFMALEFDLELSLETLYSDSSHTYIRVHTDPEFIIDFWGPMFCVYGDTVSWNEFFGQDLMRDEKATIKTEVAFSSEQLIDLGNKIFTPDHLAQRLLIHQEIEEKAQFQSSSILTV
ncbi:hypothetical protein Lmor_0773 [Legionella moravica]|uniref:Uncharacterized protein n=1 Tax=Legionella moravica TaxID=39962 RepID=A0A378JWG3_9GAMM|nr:hypothetical protein [Legionella moravica]KTD35326.1 hypothetical protein Lmor_0773 [Legionella moravica]STX62357.1 Uncharacterised protein [Legionella moravica]